MREEIEPVFTEIKEGARKGELRIDHPSYALCGVSRISGGRGYLFGSDFCHHNTIRLTIKTAHLIRGLSTDWPHSDKSLIEIEMSESQWAALISSFNVGDGVPVTLRYSHGKVIEGIKNQVPKDQHFRREINEHLQTVREITSAAMDVLGELKLSNKDRERMQKALDAIKREAFANTPFVAKCFEEHMENEKERAKVEINAYQTHMFMAAGIEALKGNSIAHSIDVDEK